MFMAIPAWDVSGELDEKNNLNRPHVVSLTVSDGDVEAVFRALRASGYTRITLQRHVPFGEVMQAASNSPRPKDAN